MNIYLLSSAIISGFIHVLFLYVYYPTSNIILPAYYSIGILTSLLNHGLTNKFFTILDRSIMSIGLFVDIYFVENIPNKHSDVPFSTRVCVYTGIFVAAFSYFFTKLLIYERRDDTTDYFIYIPHFMAHACLTATHCTLIILYKVD
jgi:hypothetical protein